ncbi:thiol-disulfide oxidoreductase DCC family protein [Ottowia testudinis]|uniref:DUF393 domain-containing protein n=1 Tax=Ottowia testudinis TaxID=2816950 RepID=A0A975CJH6_9BURK|nr:DUF393 domain-containing protein [Ottowia testudinis]QTD46734.1 DUF393 domain-containing protein [Ottowia testudinis]
MNPSHYPLTLYFDASCPLCAAEMENLRLRDAAGRLRFVDASAPGFDAALAGATVAELMTLMHARTADGRLLRGVPAFELAYEAVGLTTVSTALRAPVLRPLLNALYPVIARHRQRLPRPLVQLIFGRALRRAATQAASCRCDAASGCSVERR